jgi:hypothetical protein
MLMDTNMDANMDTNIGNIYIVANESDHMGSGGLPPEYLHKIA